MDYVDVLVDGKFIYSKKDYDLEKYSSIKEVKFWHFYEGSGKKMSRFYRQNDHLELIIDKNEYLVDVLSGLDDIIQKGKLNEKFNNIKVRVTYKKEGE